jgi:hypothetical protein
MSPWVEFTENFDFSPAALKGMSTLAYKKGTKANVTRECAEKAIAAKKAKEVSKDEDR